MMLTTGPAASWFGTSVLMATPRALKHEHADDDGHHEGADVVGQVDAESQPAHGEKDDDLDRGDDHGADDDRR